MMSFFELGLKYLGFFHPLVPSRREKINIFFCGFEGIRGEKTQIFCTSDHPKITKNGRVFWRQTDSHPVVCKVQVHSFQTLKVSFKADTFKLGNKELFGHPKIVP